MKPVWSRGGRELFYLDASGLLTTVPVQTTPGFKVGNPTKLLETRYFSLATNARDFDVSRDGQRFLMIKAAPAPDRAATTPPATMVLVLNWVEELRQRLPVN